MVNDKEILTELLCKYFDIGDSYAYNLTRVKTAFDIGTMTLEDFEEFTEDTITDLADYLMKNKVRPKRQGKWVWNKNHWECSCCRGSRFHNLLLGCDAAYCGYCGAEMTEEEDV